MTASGSARTTIEPEPARRIRRAPEDAEREILDAAERFLTGHEFREMRVDELMRATGMKRSTFYHYFKDRSAVIIRLLEEIEGEAAAAAAAWLAGPEGDPIEAVRTANAGVAEVWHRHRHVLRAVLAGSFHDPSIEGQYRALIHGLTAAVVQRLRLERDRGRTAVADPEETARALSLMNAAVFAERLGRDPADDPAEVSATLARIWISVIYPDAARL
jgi:TetR/AcrR family transcriptional regulator, ethionamide resistance regulator